MNPKIKELINTVKRLINELEIKDASVSNKSNIDTYAFDVVDKASFSEPIMKMEDEL